MLQRLLLAGAMLSSTSIACISNADVSHKVEAKVVYGEDNRKDLYDVTDAGFRRVAASTVALVRKTGLSVEGVTWKIHGKNYQMEYGLCREEPFAMQNTAAFCSGFLVAPDTIMTAGHCVASEDGCKTTAFVFDFAYQTPSAVPTHAKVEDVYACKSVIYSQAVAPGADFAVIKLDRPVVGREPLRLQTEEVRNGDPLVVMGYPAGLPLKVAEGASVRDDRPRGYFVANLDTYGGNSGSAVFNTRSLEVAGILVRGEQDFTYTDRGCMLSKVCANDECRGEDVTRISEAVRYLPASVSGVVSAAAVSGKAAVSRR